MTNSSWRTIQESGGSRRNHSRAISHIVILMCQAQNVPVLEIENIIASINNYRQTSLFLYGILGCRCAKDSINPEEEGYKIDQDDRWHVIITKGYNVNVDGNEGVILWIPPKKMT